MLPFLSSPSARHRGGVTLIELLIVVAIIAILAAIAVPNFLEAQTRAKISRVKADMRSVATAMETYVVDYNRYPVPSDEAGTVIMNPSTAVSVSPFETRVPTLLTTPIAYMTSRPSDPFSRPKAGESPLYHVTTMDHIDILMNAGPPHNWRLVFRSFHRDLYGTNPPGNIRYVMQSWGPDHVHDMDVPHVTAPATPHTHNSGTLYDPTNGTISGGDIVFFGPGRGFQN